LLYERYENLIKEELFIVGFIPRVLFLPRRQALQVALAFAKMTKTKTIKRIQVRWCEVKLQMMCVLEESSRPSFIVGVGWFGANKWGNHREPPPHGGMQPLAKGGARRRRRGCSCTQGAPTPRWACLTTAFALSVLW
jgi:hypothetical protein